MPLETRGQNLRVSEALRTYVERRIQFALARFGARIERVTVRLTDVNGPRGGVDKQCRIAVLLAGSNRVLVEDEDADLNVAIDRASDRAGPSAARQLERARTVG